MNSRQDRIFHPDAARVRQAFNRSAESYDRSAVLELEVMERLLQRLDLVRLEPELILDAGAGTCRAIPNLRRRYPASRILAVDFAEQMVAAAPPPIDGQHAICADLGRLPLPDDSVDLVFCNLALPWVADIDRVFGEFYRVLKPRGLVGFSCYGPDTLYELRQAWSETDADRRFLDFPDMHNIGDALVHNGLAEPVMDAEHFTLTYDSVRKLLDDLIDTGAQNVIQGTMPKLVSGHNVRALEDAYERFRHQGKLPATYEVVYGHAWGPIEKRARPAGPDEFRIPASSIGLRTKD
ncbi:MAG: malonyl-ACP O-methyltransferase BioC [Gammaproteobacteria bacterium]|nr:malonyl-ACP O-methyltransferase BioC [Gammaproteobacteria bacterium]MCZ6687682.1 malonyl-ACP O-methyltransferase BioC [Gammaproteobacteria bacterium]MCZ6763233.1 malonyl-ACP O-methyltransferase BioC [Gammaproteobacteria bacterium]MCZ6879952.1 malonyl-ACP O-methyltransferase BioC [Gammaproteobacteria bacterium]TDJ13303.1 MAG: malonyl-[acyl-carrier protein] O-methyltransferase BioC [Gammaproteobacteria bacterium]